MKTRFEALRGHRDDYKLYVRFDPTLNGNGGGGDGDNDNGGPDSGTLASRDGHTVLVGSDPVTKTNAVNRDYAVPVFSALDASRPFLAVSNGFAGADSDGLKQLDASHRLTAAFAAGAGRQPGPDRARRPRSRRRLQPRPRLRPELERGRRHRPALAPRGPVRLHARVAPL